MPGQGSFANGTGTAARFIRPTGLVFDHVGNLYVADHGNHLIRVIAPGGVVSTVTGQVGVCGANNGSAAAAELCEPYGIAINPAGNLIVTDGVFSTIREVTPAGQVITVGGVAGSKGMPMARAPRRGSARRAARPSTQMVCSTSRIPATTPSGWP